MMPHDARIRHMNYFGSILADVKQYQKIVNLGSGFEEIKYIGEPKEKVVVSIVPVAVKSDFCASVIKKETIDRNGKYDPGGYFIVGGNEKVIISQERMVDNKIMVFNKKDPKFEDGITKMVQVNSRVDETSSNLQIFNLKMRKDNSITVSMSNFTDIDLVIVLRAMGMTSDYEIMKFCSYDEKDQDFNNVLSNSINPTLETNINIRTQDQAIDYLITKLKKIKKFNETSVEIAEKQKKMYMMRILKKDLLPHQGEDLYEKACYICLCVNKLINCYLGRVEVDDRDEFENKRIDTPGVLLGQIWEQNFKKMLNDCGKYFDKHNIDDDHPINIIGQIKPNIIEQGLKNSLATGNWGITRTKKGVAQALQRLSYLQTISYFRRIMMPSTDAATANVTSIRSLKNSCYGFTCPIETPEGQKIGSVKSLSQIASITISKPNQNEIILKLLDKSKIIKTIMEINQFEMKNYVKVFINGKWIGLTSHPDKLRTLIKENKMNHTLDYQVGFKFNAFEGEIHLLTEGGRLIRPVLNVENNELVLTKKMLDDIEKDNKMTMTMFIMKYPKVIDFIDVDEACYSTIATNINQLKQNYERMNMKTETQLNRYGENLFVRYNYCDLSDDLILGVIAGNVVLCNHNKSLRNITNFSQTKQAIGLYNTYYLDRMDISNVLWHAQRPLVQSNCMKYNKTIEMPYGENCIVAIAMYTGYNQDDSLIFNKSAVERGLFRNDSVKKYSSIIQKNPSTSKDDIFMKPDRTRVVGMKNANYDKLNEKGFIEQETKITNKDAIIGKISPIQPTGENDKEFKDSSEIFKSNVDGVVDRVHHDIYNADGYEMINMRVRMERKPIIGDKFASLHGQKGTCGILLEQKDMPFTENGMIPDIIFNPTALPSRMTMGQILECLMGKIGVLQGKFVDGTPFREIDVEELPKVLESLGFKGNGKETMYCGITGKKMDVQIFIGPVQYMRLKHLVMDKVHSRPRGPRQSLTRQPPEGEMGGHIILMYIKKQKNYMTTYNCQSHFKRMASISIRC
jgi:DNA-directed RNA polymerase II subunit RPB2